MSGGRERRAIRVQAVFHVADETDGTAIAQRMVDRAHEIANLPECECDLDVTVAWEPSSQAAQPAPTTTTSPPPPTAA